METIKKYGPILEVGAGSGYWASLLSEQGVDIKAYDIQPWSEYQNNTDASQWKGVLIGDENVILKYPDRNLFLCWPPNFTYPLASKALHLFRGMYVIYIGEAKGGKTADDEFFDLLEVQFDPVEIVQIPKWPGFEDVLTVYKRKGAL